MVFFFHLHANLSLGGGFPRTSGVSPKSVDTQTCLIMDSLLTPMRSKSIENGGDGAPPSSEKINRPFVKHLEGRAPSRPCLYVDKCVFGARNVANGHRMCLAISGTLH